MSLRAPLGVLLRASSLLFMRLRANREGEENRWVIEADNRFLFPLYGVETRECGGCIKLVAENVDMWSVEFEDFLTFLITSTPIARATLGCMRVESLEASFENRLEDALALARALLFRGLRKKWLRSFLDGAEGKRRIRADLPYLIGYLLYHPATTRRTRKVLFRLLRKLRDKEKTDKFPCIIASGWFGEVWGFCSFDGVASPPTFEPLPLASEGIFYVPYNVYLTVRSVVEVGWDE